MTSVMELLLLFTAIFGVVMSKRFPHEEWRYGETKGDVLGPKDWEKRWEDCGHDRQSPININRNVVSASISPLRMTFDNARGLVTGELENNGHSPELKVDDKAGAELTGGPLGRRKFKLLQFHVHFGCKNSRGSEHTLRGKKFSGELHMVFEGPSKRLAVIALWIKVRPHGNRVFGRLANLMDHITEQEKSTDVRKRHGIRLMDLLPSDCGKGSRKGPRRITLDCYYTYEGSLTTPHCDEKVHWLVLKRYLYASNSQLRKFRKLESKYGRHPGRMCDNYRETQDLNGRPVFSVRGH